MLIENILIATIGGTIGYLAGILTKDNAKEIDINNIVKYEYMPVGEVEEVSVKDVREGKITEFKLVDGDKELVFDADEIEEIVYSMLESVFE